MVKTALLMVFSMAVAALSAGAQDATDLDLRERNPDVTPTPVTESSATVPELSQLDEAFKRSSLGKEADERRLHIEWRELANRMTNDPEVMEAKKSAHNARTDHEKRERLRIYYNLYYGKMRALASSDQMKHALDMLKEQHLSYINQPRVRHETDGALPTPQPTPRRGKKK